MLVLILSALLACSQEAEEGPSAQGPAEEASSKPVDRPPQGGSMVDPATYHHHSVHGQVTGPDGKPLAGTSLLVGRSDGEVEEPSPLGDEGAFVFHIREENSGPPPWTLTFAAPGHVSQSHEVPGPPPEEGLRFDIALLPES